MPPPIYGFFSLLLDIIEAAWQFLLCFSTRRGSLAQVHNDCEEITWAVKGKSADMTRDYLPVEMQVRIQDLCKGGPSEILPTSCSGVAVATKIWASKFGVGGWPPAPPPRSAPGDDCDIFVLILRDEGKTQIWMFTMFFFSSSSIGLWLWLGQI